MRQLPYLFAEAARGFKANKFLSATSVMTIGICSSVFALCLLLLHSVLSLTSYEPEDAVVRVFLEPAAETPERMAALGGELRRIPGVDSLVFVDKQAALEEFRREVGEEMLQALEVNPLPHSYLVIPTEDYAPASRNRVLRRRLARLDGVEEVSAGSYYLSWLDKWRSPIWIAASLLMLFVSGALALIIHNAVKLNLYARRILVENMKYCGAGEGFIITPFLLEGVLLGLCGGLIGVAVAGLLTYGVRLVSPLTAEAVPFWSLTGLLLGLNILIASMASARTVRGFLREDKA